MDWILQSKRRISWMFLCVEIAWHRCRIRKAEDLVDCHGNMPFAGIVNLFVL